MTALSKYQRLEASAIWRDSISGQRRDVIVSLGDASLVITDKNERPLTHWSLASVQRTNPGAMPAVFHPDGDPDETLELGENETEMVEAIEQLRQVIERRRPKPGRLRVISFLTILTLFAALMFFWMPSAVRDYTLRVLPDVTERDIGNGLLQELERFTGRACTSSLSKRALYQLSNRLFDRPVSIVILREGVESVRALPGNIIVVSHTLVEDYDNPDVLAGFLLQLNLDSEPKSMLQKMLETAGFIPTFRLLTTGHLPQTTLAESAKGLLNSPATIPADSHLINAFFEHEVAISPYALARDITGQDTAHLLSAEFMRPSPARPVLNDTLWVGLQGICGG